VDDRDPVGMDRRGSAEDRQRVECGVKFSGLVRAPTRFTLVRILPRLGLAPDDVRPDDSRLAFGLLAAPPAAEAQQRGRSHGSDISAVTLD
jgi:hypothetical protein